jgi:hypothetical protein
LQLGPPARFLTFARVVCCLQVNIKLSIKLSLPQHGTDPDALIGRARSWLQSAALDKILQSHGLRIGAGSPAHLVTLMSTTGSGGIQGIDEVIEVDGSNPVAAAAAATAAGKGADAHHEQPELGQGHRRSGYAASGMSAWGRLQPNELKPLVLGHGDPSVLAAPPPDAVGPSNTAGQDNDIGKRTVLGAIIGAVLGSAALGAALAVVVAAAVRRRRMQQGGAAGGCSAGDDGGSRIGRVSLPGPWVLLT